MLGGCDEAWAGCVDVSITVIVKSIHPLSIIYRMGRVLGRPVVVMGTVLPAMRPLVLVFVIIICFGGLA